MTHMDAKKNECNFFWISDDFLSTSVVCRHCDEVAGDVDEGSLLQVRRYMHRNVVHVEDLSRAHDCRGIQSYYINQKRAILLEPKEQNAGSTPAFDTNCVTCDVPLRPDCSFCSLYCELNAPKEAFKSMTVTKNTSIGKKRWSPMKRQGSGSSAIKRQHVVFKAHKARAGRPAARLWSRKLKYPQRSPEE